VAPPWPNSEFKINTDRYINRQTGQAFNIDERVFYFKYFD
jgi:hypothetical protein